DGGVVDEDDNPLTEVDDGGRGRADVRRGGVIRLPGAGIATCVRDGLGGGARPAVVHIEHRDAGPITYDPRGGGTADARAATGDDGYASFEPHTRLFSSGEGPFHS